MGAVRTYPITGNEEADERWREVLCELVKRASVDVEFRARVEATGAVIGNLDALLAKVGAEASSAPTTLAAREYWWGFRLELPHAVLAAWTTRTTDVTDIEAALARSGASEAEYRSYAAAWIVSCLAELGRIDLGCGLVVNMTWMAPYIFVPVVVSPR